MTGNATTGEYPLYCMSQHACQRQQAYVAVASAPAYCVLTVSLMRAGDTHVRRSSRAQAGMPVDPRATLLCARLWPGVCVRPHYPPAGPAASRMHCLHNAGSAWRRVGPPEAPGNTTTCQKKLVLLPAQVDMHSCVTARRFVTALLRAQRNNVCVSCQHYACVFGAAVFALRVTPYRAWHLEPSAGGCHSDIPR